MDTTEHLNNFWYIACPAAELGDRPIRRYLDGEPLVLFRDSGGRPRALIDRCAHRGMALSAGRVVGDCVECPYHGWQYDGDGGLCHLPALAEGETRPRPKMRTFDAVERDEHIWLWAGEGPPQGEPFHFPYAGEPGWTTFFMHTRFEAPVEACLENFLDVPHTLFVHPGLFRGEDSKETRIRVTRESGSAVAEFIGEQGLQGWGPRLVAPKAERMQHTDRFILPSITRVDYVFGEDKAFGKDKVFGGDKGKGDEYRFVITSQCTTRRPGIVDVTTAVTWRLRLPPWLLKPFLKLYCRHVIRQDVDILKTHGEQIKRFGPVTIHTRADLLARHIRTLRRRAAEGREPAEEITDEFIMKI